MLLVENSVPVPVSIRPGVIPIFPPAPQQFQPPAVLDAVLGSEAFRKFSLSFNFPYNIKVEIQ